MLKFILQTCKNNMKIADFIADNATVSHVCIVCKLKQILNFITYDSMPTS